MRVLVSKSPPPILGRYFISFSEGLGATQDEGMLIGGASYRAGPWNLGAVNYWVNDILNTAYGEIDYLFPHGSGGGDSPVTRLISRCRSLSSNAGRSASSS